jgi:hypothetical protein
VKFAGAHARAIVARRSEPGSDSTSTGRPAGGAALGSARFARSAAAQSACVGQRSHSPRIG